MRGSQGVSWRALRACTRAALAGALVASLTASIGVAQGGRGERAEVDPYTQGDRQAMDRAGYRTFGPFLWADDHTTEVAAQSMGGVPVLWVETEHFKIGCSLDPYELNDPKEKKAIRKELDQLKKRIKSVKSKTGELDPWLRLHLLAMRLEDTYGAFLEAFGLEEEDFPGPDMGAGPYLGMKDKFCVLALEKSSSLARYTATYCGQPIESSYRFYFPKSDTMFVGLAFESLTGSYRNEQAMAYAVIFQVVAGMVNTVRGYTHELPLWCTFGIARWFARKYDYRWLLFIGDGRAMRKEEEAEWEPKVRARAGHGPDAYTSTSDLFAIQEYSELGFNDHMFSWSRIDYLMSLGPEVARKFLLGMNEPVPWLEARPRAEVLAEQFQRAFVEATGLEPDAFDEAWAAWVKKEYSKR